VNYEIPSCSKSEPKISHFLGAICIDYTDGSFTLLNPNTTTSFFFCVGFKDDIGIVEVILFGAKGHRSLPIPQTRFSKSCHKALKSVVDLLPECIPYLVVLTGAAHPNPEFTLEPRNTAPVLNSGTPSTDKSWTCDAGHEGLIVGNFYQIVASQSGRSSGCYYIEGPGQSDSGLVALSREYEQNKMPFTGAKNGKVNDIRSEGLMASIIGHKFISGVDKASTVKCRKTAFRVIHPIRPERKQSTVLRRPSLVYRPR